MSADGTTGAGITDRDRETATVLLYPELEGRDLTAYIYSVQMQAQVDRIAAALAEERRRVLAPMLALADELDRTADAFTGIDDAIDGIRRAAESEQGPST